VDTLTLFRLKPRAILACVAICLTGGVASRTVVGQQLVSRSQRGDGGRTVDADAVRLLLRSQAAVIHHTFHVTRIDADVNAPTWIDVQMGPLGRPRFLALYDHPGVLGAFNDFTGQLAQSCGGHQLPTELVVHYGDGVGGLMNVEARERDADDVLAEVFEMYGGERPMTLGPRAKIDGHDARALVAAARATWNAPAPVSASERLEAWLWIDLDSFYPVRFQEHKVGRASRVGYRFSHAPNLDLAPPSLPEGLSLPNCVKDSRHEADVAGR
jgi:hypothetical protein